MAFKLTFSDGHESDYDDDTKWEVEDGVLKLGKEAGKWSVFLSPSHWATLELATGKGNGDGKDERKDSDKDEDKDEGKGKHESKDDDEDKDDEDKNKNEDKDKS
ncbi:MAG: hypothetical protein WB785_07605 [Mycobacterium sp.]|uniref:hypothetical protein n=1 Tax=Mycobacterium sp. TaxID=1785 RepID=UPI003C3C712D